MTKKLKKSEITGFIFVVILGSIGHFLYEWTGQNQIVGKFFAVNESTWEHLKLLFFPYVIYTVVEWACVGKNYHGFWLSKLLGVLSGMVFVIAVFYTYTGVIGYSIDFLNIIIFVLSAAAAFYVSYKLLTSNMRAVLKIPSIVGFIVIGILFVVFTSNPPKINLFKDPVTYGFGTENAADTFTQPVLETKLL